MKSLHHSFDIDIASEYGIEEALIIHHFQHWITLNKRLDRNLLKGRTWTYQTQDEICANFPYWDRFQVMRIIKKLIDKGVLVKENFNSHKYDRTIWYAFVEEEKFVSSGIVRKCTMENAEVHNGLSESAPPIPDTKTDTKTVNCMSDDPVDRQELPKIVKNNSISKAASRTMRSNIRRLTASESSKILFWAARCLSDFIIEIPV